MGACSSAFGYQFPSLCDLNGSFSINRYLRRQGIWIWQPHS